MRRWFVLVAPFAVAGCDLDLTGIGLDCDFKRDFYESAPVSGTDLVRIIAEAGDLRIEGRSNLSEVRVRGRGCADDRRGLEDLALVVQRSGSSVRVLTFIPEGGGSSRIDLTVEVPDWMLLEIDDTSGDIDIENVAGVDILDDSGNIDLEDVTGDVFVNDGSGELDIFDVIGNVFIADGSGSIDVRGVAGSVLVEEDGSGDINVEDVRGDFTVELDGSGRITYRNIGGRVSLPR